MSVRRSRGYTLIELAIGLVILGLVLVLIWRFGSTASQRYVEINSPPILETADQALTGFVAAQHRLPCPDTAGDGLEHCGGAVVGRLPVVTLRLARADLANVRYGVFRAASATAPADADLAVAKDRFYPLLSSPAGPALAAGTGTPLGVSNGIDFCDALLVAGGRAPTTTALSIRNDGGALIKNVAYALALPGGRDADGDGNPFDGANTIADAFAASTQPISATYDDMVLAVDFGQLFDRIACSGTLAAASHAHPNANFAEAIVYRAGLDYKVQLQLADDMADAMVASSAAAVATAAGGAATAAANVLIAAAEATLSKGTASALIGFAAAAVAVSAAAITTASVRAALATEAKALADQKIVEFAVILADELTLSTSIYNNAVAADAAGLY
jgi:prepilin-type N-terminal cleavage/methylation domain-containing protein